MIAARLLLQVWVVAFMGLFGSELLGGYPELRVLAQVAFVLPLAVWAALHLRGPRDRLDWAVLLSLAALALVSVLSVDPTGSLETVGLAAAYALAFFGARDLGRRPVFRRAVAVAVCYALLFWLLMTAVWWIAEKAAWIGVFGSMPNLESYQVFIWGTANAIPVLSLLALAFIGWQKPGRVRLALVGIWAVASVVVIPLSAGRAAWLGFAAALILYEALSGWPRVRRTGRWLRGRHLLIPAQAVVVLAVAGAVFLLAARGEALFEANLSDRLQIWSQALAIFAADPLTGGGPSTYSWLRLAHVPDYTFAVGVRLAHDVPMLTLADGGLVLTAGFGGLVVTFLVSALRRVQDRRSRVSLAVLVGLAVASLLDDFSSLPAVMVAAIILAGWTVPWPEESEAAQPSGEPAATGSWHRFITPATLLAVGVLAISSVVSIDRARVAAADARADAVSANWPDAVAEFTSATDVHPADAGYWLGLGLARWNAGDADSAAQAYERARQLSPGDPRPWGALAALTTESGKRIELLAEASKRTMTDPQYAFRLGDALQAAGRTDEALEAYGLALAIDSQLAGSFPAAGPPASRPELQDVAGAAERIAGEVDGRDIYIHGDWVTWDIGLADGELPAGAGPAWRAVQAAHEGNLEAARAFAAQAQQEAPFDSHTTDALIWIARSACDRDRYEQLIRLLGPYRPHRVNGVQQIREHTYREDSLGTYQPLESAPLPEDQRWPALLIGSSPACPGWTP